MWSAFFVLFATIGNAHVIRRDNTDLGSLEILERDVQALTKAGTDYQGGFLGALAIERAESRLVKNLKSGTETVKNQHPDHSESELVIDYMKMHLEPNIKATTQALTQKHAQVEEAGMLNTVHGAMMSLKTDVDKYFAALVGSLDASTKNEGAAAWSAIDQDLDKAIEQFSTGS